jgi:hypothetical protein
MTQHQHTITAPQPHYGEDEDRYPHVLFKLPDNSYRVIYSRPASGFTAWRLQSRRSRTLDYSTWGHLVSARAREGFLQGLAAWGANDPDLLAFVNTLPDRIA